MSGMQQPLTLSLSKGVLSLRPQLRPRVCRRASGDFFSSLLEALGQGLAQDLQKNDGHQGRDVDHADAGHDPSQRREDGLCDLVQHLD